MKKIFLILLVFMPMFIKRYCYNTFFGWDISPDAKIGFSYISVGYVFMGQGAIIKDGTVIKGLDILNIDDFGRIGRLNWISGSRTISVELCRDRDRDVLINSSSLIMGEHSAITNRHYIDCIAAVSIGRFTTLAGVKSTILTHSVDVYNSVQASNPIFVGEYCFIGTDTVILGGANIANNVVVGAKSLVRGALADDFSLYAGVPVKKIKDISHEACYFTRTLGVVK